MEQLPLSPQHANAPKRLEGDTLQQLARVDMFAGLDDDRLQRLADVASERSFDTNELIFNEGDPGDGFHVITDGTVRIFKAAPSGREQTLHVFGPGSSFAEVAVFRHMDMPANAVALTPARTLFFPRIAFTRLLEADSGLAMNMLALMAIRLHQFASRIEQLALKEAPQRLASHLLLLAASMDAQEFTLDLPKNQLAALLGTTPETISRAIKRMRDDGLITVTGQRITILNEDGLEELASGI